jgi:hypothetical protein
MTAPSHDRFDETRRAWIAAHQGASPRSPRCALGKSKSTTSGPPNWRPSWPNGWTSTPHSTCGPSLYAATGLGAFDAAVCHWDSNGRTRSLGEILDLAFTTAFNTSVG